jgi:hypothetical protein
LEILAIGVTVWVGSVVRIVSGVEGSAVRADAGTDKENSKKAARKAFFIGSSFKISGNISLLITQ